MSEFGLDEIAVIDKEVATDDKMSKKKPFITWQVGENEYKLKLKTAVICQLEEKFKTNLFNLLNGNIPPLGIMLTIIHGAMKEYEHGIKFTNVQGIFDRYCDDGGTQLTLLTDVIMPLMMVSGFFTESQSEEMETKMQEVKEQL